MKPINTGIGTGLSATVFCKTIAKLLMAVLAAVTFSTAAKAAGSFTFEKYDPANAPGAFHRAAKMMADCSTCEYAEVFLKPQIDHSDTSCCFSFYVDIFPGACAIYGVRLSSVSGFLSSHYDFDWPLVNQTSTSATWMTPNLPLQIDSSEQDDFVLVSLICFSPATLTKTITVEYLDSNGYVLCSETFTNSCCKNCDEGMYAIELEGVEKLEDKCCVQLNLKLDSGACELGGVEVMTSSGYSLNFFNPPLQPGQSMDSALVICTGAGMSPQNFVVKLLDKDLFVACKDSIEVDCDDCCLWTHVDHVPGLGSLGRCRGIIKARFDSAAVEGCGLVYAVTDAPLYQIGVPNTYETWFYYDVPPGTNATYHVYFVTPAGDTICTKEVKVFCWGIIVPCNCGTSVHKVITKGITKTANNCCVQLGIEANDFGCPINSVTINRQGMPPVHIFFTPPILPGEKRDSIYTLCTPPGINPQNVFIRYKDAFGNVMCMDTIPIDCDDCCLWAHVDLVPNIPSVINATHCTGIIKARFDASAACHFAYISTNGPITLMSFPNANETWFHYQIPFGTSFTYNIYFIDVNGDTICTKQVDVSCNPIWIMGGALGTDGDVLTNELVVPTLKCVPNPATEYTGIQYTLPFGGLITLDIVTIAGQVLETLETGQRQAGVYTYRYGTAHLPAGVYIVRLAYKGNVFYNRLSILR